MKKIRNLHTLQLEKERLKAECRMKEMQLHNRINHIGDALPDLLWLLLPRKARSVWGILRSIVQTFAGGEQGTDGNTDGGEGRVFRTAFQVFRKIFSRNKEKETETNSETTTP